MEPHARAHSGEEVAEAGGQARGAIDGSGGSGSVQALMGHLAWQMVTILHGVRGTPEEVRWLISKYNLKRIKKICACLVINVQT